ncbi:hypothetical protein GOP47_0010447 [Adiantum capillus-veneris]|uniref:Terpene synthase n=1 Tax=Adiantum capillus-veneris TaxID=13818 RepID=A0A9D4ZIR9_ADICA|nr:hypothetical protein GOP47_0010447 [Adiantum capillus-veneris]
MAVAQQFLSARSTFNLQIYSNRCRNVRDGRISSSCSSFLLWRLATQQHVLQLSTSNKRCQSWAVNKAGRERLNVCANLYDGGPGTWSSSTSTILKAASTGRKLRMPSAEDLARMQLPALASSFAWEVHPHYEGVKAACDEWIERVAQLPSASASRFLRDCLLPRLVCLFIPRAQSRRRLVQAIKIIAWLMIADDDDDHPQLLGSDFDSTSHRADRLMAILTHPPSAAFDSIGADPRLSTRCSKQLAALAEVWQETCTEMSPLVRTRFTSTMADYLEGIKMQAALRKNVFVPDVDSYMEIRHHASFTVPAFIMVEYASGIELDQETLQNPKVTELCKKAVDYISLCNDVFSCYKEITIGDFFNLPSILYSCDLPIASSTKPLYTSFQDAVDHVAQLAKDLDACCTSLIASLKDDYSKPSIDPSSAHQMHAYVDVMALGMSGALAWFFETPRYPQPCTQNRSSYIGHCN